MAARLVKYSKTLLEKFVDAIPFIVYFGALFFTVYGVFGAADALVGIVFLFFAHAIVNEPGLSFANYFRRSCWMLVMCLVSTLAGMSQLAFIIITPLYLFFITIMNSDDYLPRNFYWLGMGYLLLLVFPVGIDGIPSRLMAVVVSILATTFFVYVMRAIYRKTGKLNAFTRDEEYVKRAFSDVGLQLRALAQNAGATSFAETYLLNSRIHPKSAFSIAQEYAEMEYGSVFRQNGLLSGRQNYTFSLLLCCEQLADIVHAAANSTNGIDDIERAYLFDLSSILLDHGRESTEGIEAMADQLEVFLQTHKLEQSCYEESWRAILEALIRTLRDTQMQHDETTPFMRGLRYRFRFFRENFSFKHTQTRFALRLAIIVGVAVFADVVFTDIFDAQFGIWIPITAFAVTNTYNDETLRSTANTMFGTFLGLVVFMAFVHFIPEAYRMFIVVPLSYLIMLMDIHPIASATAGAQLALTALYPSATLALTLFGRLIWVFVGVTFVMLIIFSFARTKRSVAIQTKIQELERIDTRLVAHIHQGLESGHVSLWRTVQLLYYLHMNAGLLEELASDLDRALASYSIHADKFKTRKRVPEEDKRLKAEVERVLQANYQFAMDAEHAVMLLDPRRIPEQLIMEPSENAAPHEPLDTISKAELAAILDIPDETGPIPISVSNLDLPDPDSTARIKHIDATAERLDEKIRQLEEMHVIEDIPEQDVFGTTDQFSIVGDQDHVELTASTKKRRARKLRKRIRK